MDPPRENHRTLSASGKAIAGHATMDSGEGTWAIVGVKAAGAADWESPAAATKKSTLATRAR
jgi:hypothetical protein